MPTLSKDRLFSFAEQLLKAGGADDHESHVVANSLVESNLRGHDSHGVMRIPFYVQRMQDGILQSGQRLQILKESDSTLYCDGGWGFGQVLSRELTQRMIEKAATSGIVCGTLQRSAHMGRLGEYAEMAASHGMASMICANTHGAAQRVAPVGGKRPRLGTNPLCMGMPGGAQGPFILDFGTSATAEGKVRVKKIAGQPVPDGWILDSDGQPTTDPNQLYADPPGTIRPMGGDQAYKGFGLAFLIEMLCGGLTGGQCAFPSPPPPIGNCAVLLVINPALFGGAEHIKREILALEDYVRNVPRVDGVDHVTLPGDPERQVAEQRRRDGIPIDAGNWEALVTLANTSQVSVPD